MTVATSDFNVQTVAGLRLARSAKPVRTKTTPTPMAIAATPKLTTW